MALVLSGALIAVCTLVRLVGQRLDDAEDRRSRRQWQVMCEALDLEDFAAVADQPRCSRSPEHRPVSGEGVAATRVLMELSALARKDPVSVV